MTTRTLIALKSVTLALVAALVLTGPTPVRAEDEPKPLASTKHPLGVTVEVMAVTLDDTQDKLKVTWRYKNATQKPIRILKEGIPGQLRKNQPWVPYFDTINYRAGKLNDKTAARYPVVQTVDGKFFDATDVRAPGIVVPAEGTFEMYAKFPKPPAGVTKIHLQLPEVEQLENLPVTSGKKKD